MKKKVEARITQKKTEIQPISQQNQTYLQTHKFSQLKVEARINKNKLLKRR